MTVAGQVTVAGPIVPAVPDVLAVPPCAGALNLSTALAGRLVGPLLAATGATVTVTGAGPNLGPDCDIPVDASMLVNEVVAAVTRRIDVDREAALHAVWTALVQPVDIHPARRTRELFLAHYSAQAGLPWRSDTVMYTIAGDVIPAATDVATAASGRTAAAADPVRSLFVALGHTVNPRTLGVCVPGQDAFAALTRWVGQQIRLLAPVVPPATTAMLHRFTAFTPGDLVEAVRIRAHEGDQNNPYSFARVLHHLVVRFCHQAGPGWGLLPFDLAEWALPQTITFVDAAAHATADPRVIVAAWQRLDRALADPVTVLPHAVLCTITAVRRRTHALRELGDDAPQRAVEERWSAARRPPTAAAIARQVAALTDRLPVSAATVNARRVPVVSHMVASRRYPTDPNRPGRAGVWRHRRDLHVFLDTSISIDQEQYRQAVVAIALMAGRLNVALWVSSFSTVVSQPTFVDARGLGPKAVWRRVRAIPKVTGGTDFSQVWRWVEAHPVRRARVNLMVTDFQWAPRADQTHHPASVFYAPCSTDDWPGLAQNAEHFVRACAHLDPHMGRRLMAMGDPGPVR